MRQVLVLFAAAGCNSVFGIETTGVVDGPPAADAAPPPVCPTDGTPPTFANELYMVPAKFCVSYAISETTGTAAALCTDDVGGYTPGTGTVDRELTAIAFSTPMAITPSDVRLSPEGDRLLLSGTDSSYYARIEEYALNNGTWEHKDEVMFTSAQYYTAYISPPSAGESRHMIAVYYDLNGLEKTIELAHDSTGWRKVSDINYSELGVDNIAEPSLSADGLWFVFVSGITTNMTTTEGKVQSDQPIGVGGQIYQRDVYVASRPSIDKPFMTPAQKIASVPSEVSWPHMTSDCGRIYFSALNTVFYLKQ